MKALVKPLIAAAGLALAAQAAAQVTFYEREGFRGQSFSTDRPVRDFERFGFSDRASSADIVSERWEVCDGVRFTGRCVVLRPGRYPSLAAMGLDNRISSMRNIDRDAHVDNSRYAPGYVPAAAAGGQVTFFQREGFEGRAYTTDKPIDSLARFGFDDQASSVEVVGAAWEICDQPGFSGRCVVLRPGRYPSLAAMRMDNRVSSARTAGSNARIDEGRYAPPPVAAAYDYRRRNGERLFEASVTSVRAVLGTPEQRCWVEREQVVVEHGGSNVPGAIAGAVIGGILGHQIGNGRGKDVATAGGAVAGAAIGANAGRSGPVVQSQDIQRCASVPGSARADFWDVTYNFRGEEHRVQMSAPPGATITVNEWGEPRV